MLILGRRPDGLCGKQSASFPVLLHLASLITPYMQWPTVSSNFLFSNGFTEFALLGRIMSLSPSSITLGLVHADPAQTSQRRLVRLYRSWQCWTPQIGSTLLFCDANRRKEGNERYFPCCIYTYISWEYENWYHQKCGCKWINSIRYTL